MPARETRDIILLCLWAGMIFLVSNVPALKSDLEQDFLLRKIAHMAEFFVLTILFVRVFRHYSVPLGDCFALAAVSALAYALTDEVHQLFVSGREGSLRDVVIDGAGITLSISLLLHPSWWRKSDDGGIVPRTES